jgi:hypothetical protein
MVWSATMQVSVVRGTGQASTLLVWYDRLKIDMLFFHTRYFMLESRLLGYYKKKSMDNMLVT